MGVIAFVTCMFIPALRGIDGSLPGDSEVLASFGRLIIGGIAITILGIVLTYLGQEPEARHRR